MGNSSYHLETFLSVVSFLFFYNIYWFIRNYITNYISNVFYNDLSIQSAFFYCDNTGNTLYCNYILLITISCLINHDLWNCMLNILQLYHWLFFLSSNYTFLNSSLFLAMRFGTNFKVDLIKLVKLILLESRLESYTIIILYHKL